MEFSILATPFCVGICVLEFANIFTYDWHYKTILHSEKKIVELHPMDRDSIILPKEPLHGLIDDIRHFSKDLDLSELDPSQKLYSKCNGNILGK